MLEENLMAATEDKNNAIAAAEKTQPRRTSPTVSSTASPDENKRWGEAIDLVRRRRGEARRRRAGRSSFVSYAGPFNSKFRDFLVNEKWLPDMIEREIPMTAGVRDPMDVLTTTPAHRAVGHRGPARRPSVDRERRHHDERGAMGADDRPAAAGHQVDQAEVG